MSVIAIAKPGDEKTDILHLEVFKGSQEEPVKLEVVQHRLEELGALFGFKHLVIESPQGVMMAQNIKIAHCKIESLHPTLKSNAERWGGLYRALKDGKVRLPPISELRRELLTLMIEDKAVGWKVVDIPSIHNDRSVAVAGALFMAEFARSGGQWSNSPFRAITPRGVVDSKGKLVESKTSNLPKWKRSGYEQQEAAERTAVENLSDSRKTRIRLLAAGGMQVHELGKQFSLSTRQVRWVLELVPEGAQASPDD